MDNKKYLSDNEIIGVIKEYINGDVYDYAVMIDGEWGSGKTYFVKNVLIPELNKQKDSNRSLYISLYGLQTVEEINKKIYMEKYIKDEKESYNIASSALSLGFDYLSNKGIKLDEENIKGFLRNFFSLKNVTLIFDDLERCSIPVNEVLGYINSFVEHQKMKVIIVANQNELSKEFDDKNLELKYLVSLNKNLLVSNNEDKNNSFTIKNNNDTKNESFTEQELIERTQKIFSQQTEYEKIKEKLIGTTIYYQPDIEKTLRILIDKTSINLTLKNKLLNNISTYVEFMKEYHHYNLRTFQFFLLKINELYNEINKLKIDSDEFMEYLLIYCFDVCCIYKNGLEVYSWNDNIDYFEMNLLDHFLDYRISQNVRLRIKFVDEYIIFSSLNKDVIPEINNIYKRQHGNEIEECNRCLNELNYHWYDSYEEDVIQMMEKVLSYLKKDSYDKGDYSKIIELFLRLETIGFDKRFVNDMRDNMIENIKNSEEYYWFSDSHKAIINENNKEDYTRLIALLNSEMEKVHQNYNDNKINTILSTSQNWMDDIIALSKKETNMVFLSNKIINIFESVDIKLLIKKIQESSPYNLSQFRRFLGSYIGDYKADMELLSQLKNGLEKTKDTPTDKIQKLQFDCLINDLKEYITITENKMKNQ